MAETPKDGARTPSPRDAAELLKDRIEYVKSKNLIDAVDQQRRRQKESQKWGRKSS